VTAQQAQAYKPSMQIFDHVYGQLGVTSSDVVHVCASPHLDLVAARDIGFRCIWIDRSTARLPLADYTPDAIFPRLGKPVVLNYIKRVEDGSGKVLEELPALQNPTENQNTPSIVAEAVQENETPVISPQTAYVMTDLLKSVIREGTGRAAASAPGAIAGKTGTSNDHRDAWFVGYSPQVVSGVWIGYLKEKALGMSETGGKAAAPIWAEYMRAISSSYSKNDFPIPEDIVFAYIDKLTGKIAAPSNPNRVRVAFKAGAVPNLAFSNIRRVGEPNLRTTTATPGESKPGESPSMAPVEEAQSPELPQDETLDFPREGYE
jgi:membrane carboxypeptidase/penicillin-binding protein